MTLWQWSSASSAALRTAVAAASCALLARCAHPAGLRPSPGTCAPCPVCGAPPRPDVLGPRGALNQFLEAAERNDFEAAYRLLAGPLRARYTPARLASDYSAVQALAQDKLARLRASADAGWRIGADQAALPLGDGRNFRLVREPEGWRIAALE